jgi:glyoxylase-like metal-dependent hydrolase (beta-lactamase superfamily II)
VGDSRVGENALETERMFYEDFSMQILNSALLLAALLLQQPAAQPPLPLIAANATVKVSEHVYVIPDRNVGAVPNVGIIVGSKATLVVDTGLGPRNGQTVLREVEKVSKNSELYIVSTHFHAEHILGESAFPSNAKIIRARAEQQDIDEFGVQPNFAARSPAMAELVKDAQFRHADEIFDAEKTLDLGGVRAKLSWYGGTHTNGDTLIFIEGDNVLFAGDVIMNRRFLGFNSPRSSVQSWRTSLEKVAPLHPKVIVPSHGEMGDGSMIETNAVYLESLQKRAAELKRTGKNVDEAVEMITAEFKSRYPDWTGNAGAAARIAYAEAK